MAIRHNSSILEYCNTSVSALSGSVAGILGLTGLYGFIFYFLTAFMMSVSEANLNHINLFWEKQIISKLRIYYYIAYQFHKVHPLRKLSQLQCYPLFNMFYFMSKLPSWWFICICSSFSCWRQAQSGRNISGRDPSFSLTAYLEDFLWVMCLSVMVSCAASVNLFQSKVECWN